MMHTIRGIVLQFNVVGEMVVFALLRVNALWCAGAEGDFYRDRAEIWDVVDWRFGKWRRAWGD